MIDALSGIAAGIGLSTSAGLNAYLPLLIVGLTARYTHLISLNEPWNVLTNVWVLTIIAVLLIIEETADRIPGIDTLNDGIQTVVRPLAGAVLFAADSGPAGQLYPVPVFGTGLLIAAGVHAAKALFRPFVTVATAGLGNWLVSTLEDVAAVVFTIIAILMPLVVLGMILVLAVFLAGEWRGRSAAA